MIRENQKLFNRLNVLSDAAAALAAITFSYLIVFNLMELERNFPLIDYIKLVLVFIPIELFTFGCMGLYDSFRTKSFPHELGRLAYSFAADGLIIIALLYVVKLMDFSRWALAIFLLLDFLIVALKRFFMRRLLKKFRESGYNQKYIAIIGSGSAAAEYLETIRSERLLGFECVGYIADRHTLDAQRLGGYDDMFSVLESNRFDEVVCALDAGESDRLSDAVEACEATGTKISIIPAIYKYMSSTPSIDMVGGIPVMNVRRIPLDNMGNAFLKRMVDVLGSLVLIILTSPVMLVCAAVVKATMGGRVIFRQERVGLNKKPFIMYKMKSMKDIDCSDTEWTTADDPRKTRFGAFMRKFSLDELPQLFNVLKGEMSLVGPRPELPHFVDQFKKQIPLYMIKHQVKPGMTGLAQINGYRGDTSIAKRIEYDIKYIENWTFFLDISILFKTALSGFVNSEKLSSGAKSEEKRQKTKTKV